VELGFIRDHRDVLTVLRGVLVGMVAGIDEHAATAADRLNVTLPAIPEDILVVHFTEALRIANAQEGEPDLAPEHERAIGAWGMAEHGSDVVAVEGYPMSERPFYTHPWSRDGVTSSEFSNSFDLIFLGTELVTAGSGCTSPRRTRRRSADGVKTRRPTRRTCKPSDTACRRTAGSPSGWNGGSPGCRSGHPRGNALPARPPPAQLIGPITAPHGRRWGIPQGSPVPIDPAMAHSWVPVRLAVRAA